MPEDLNQTPNLTGKDFFESLENSQVRVFISSDHVEVRTESEEAEEAYFVADLKTSQEGINFISFNISTVGSNYSKIGIFKDSQSSATAIARESISYFDHELSRKGSQVDGIAFYWVDPGCQGKNDNFADYIKAMNDLEFQINRGIMTIQQAKQIAASKTWEIQRIAIPNGFNQFGEIKEVFSMIHWIEGVIYR